MKPYPRLTRAQLVARLREHAAKHGFVSVNSLHEHDPIAQRSISLHFAGIAAARHAAGVSPPPYRKPQSKTGPKPGARSTKKATWSRSRVIEELRRLDREGRRITTADLLGTGMTSLVSAATIYAGGLRSARMLAGIEAPPRRGRTRTWTRAEIVRAIEERRRKGQTLASSRAPQRLVTGARWHFGNWVTALEAAGIDESTVRLPPKGKYTKEEVIKRLRRIAKSARDLRSITLAKQIRLESVRRVFGSVNAALHAAGLGLMLMSRKHGLQKWSRERVIETLKSRAAIGEHSLTPGLHRVVQLYFGGAEAARMAAGVPSPADVRANRRRRSPSPVRKLPRASRSRTRKSA